MSTPAFRGNRFFLSNFYPVAPHRILYLELAHPTSEHAFACAKANNEVDREWVANAPTPAEAKRRGRAIKARPDWEEVKDQVMLDVLRIKFAPGTELAKKLLATGSEELVELNTWHDSYWGVCQCTMCTNRPKKNQLGKTLMQIRDELRGVVKGWTS